MKPNFALSLSFESIRLLHRAPGGWRVVGEVSPESDDLIGALSALREMGTALAPDGLRCKVVIPNEQIKYLTLETPGLGPSEARDAARDALGRATPYAVDDLAFDIVQVGDVTQVAAVALETLREAEDFATEHRFHPVSFVAMPEEALYTGEPYFGPARSARDVLEPGQTVEPDSSAIVILGPVEEDDEPVPEVAEDASPLVNVMAAAPSAAPTFKSARGVDTPEDDILEEALASLRADHATAGVTDPTLPPRDVDPVAPSFSSRRSPPGSAPLVYETAPEPQVLTAFAEPAEPFVPKPRSDAEARASRAPIPAAGPVTPKVRSEAERMTVFGARHTAPADQARRGLPLGMTALLLLLLVGIGTWSFGSLQDTIAGWTGRTGPGSPEITAIGVAPPINPSVQEQPDTPPSDTEVAARPAPLSDEDAAVLDALRTPLTTEETDRADDEKLRAAYAVTGIWPRAPEVPSPPPLVDIEDLYVTSIDPIEPAFDAVALPDVAAFDQDALFDAPGSPAAAGTTFAMDGRGLVIATPDGALSPDGIRVVAGPPPAQPAAFPDRGGTSAEVNPVQSALAQFRPRSRPADLVENTERATLDGLTRDELAELRPPVRPQRPAVIAAASAASASLVPLDDAAASAEVEPSGSPLAVAASLRPDARPSNFNQIVARAQQTAASAAAIGAASIAAPAPRSVTPQIPSSASVAREATLRNAINLRKVNLIGVYGTPSARRALVRLSNGRYKKVQVGDRIDGGRVSAIGEGELRYQKRGRNIVLKMPRG
ncbi:hypothetical protein [uncultured Roseobacter sp.]|uniref:hypothetical protein n=1 Tax=uncultured Roseobacter sp. TaxID=114847 RepID=UPI00260E55F1|nr:hypothetical protein [uncultured Roseobacter sp.]